MSTSSDYKRVIADHKVGAAPASEPVRPSATIERAATAPLVGDAHSVTALTAGIEEFLQLLAKAVRQFHTYPATSPMCTDAVTLSHKAFAALDRHDRLELRVTHCAFVVHETNLGTGTVVEHELVRRLHRAHVASLDIDRSATVRDFTRLCTDVIRSDDLAKTKTTFADLLAEHGVESITARMAHRPEVLDVGARPEPVWDLLEHERNRQRAATVSGPVQYLYPPEKGWVRLEPGAATDAVSLVDLAVLVDDPSTIAAMLLRLTDDDPVDATAGDRALEQKFVDVATLFAALDPHLANVMFGKLARAVLAIDPDRRKALLQRTILPGLLDGRSDGAVLRDFPDADLAESLCLLLELETAAPEVVAAALQRLDLPDERRQTIASLVEKRMTSGEAPKTAGDEHRPARLEQLARRLLRVNSEEGKNFAEFAAFDLSIDEHAAAAIADVGPAIAETDLTNQQIECLWRLVRLEPNPALAAIFLKRMTALLGDLDRAGRYRHVVDAARRYRELAGTLKDTRPDVAEAITAALRDFCTPARLLAWLGRSDVAADNGGAAALTVQAFGESLVPALLIVLDDPALQSQARLLTTALCEHASLVAPTLVPELARCGTPARRIILRVCGFAGSGYEVPVSEHVTSRDELTVREAMRALARIGTAKAATLVSFQIHNGTPLTRAAAEEALWHLPRSQTVAQLRELLGHRDFVTHNPAVVTRLIERAAQGGITGLDGALEGLASLRYRFWNPGVVRVALKARELRGR